MHNFKDNEKNSNAESDISIEESAAENFAQNWWDIPEDIKADYGTSQESEEETEKAYIDDPEEIIRKIEQAGKWRKRQILKRRAVDAVITGGLCLAGAVFVGGAIGAFTEIFAGVAGDCYVKKDLKAQGIDSQKISDGFEFYKDDNSNYLYGTVKDKSGQEWDVYYDLRGTKHGKIEDFVNYANAARELEPIVVERQREIPEELTK